jgi:hypothetical protein
MDPLVVLEIAGGLERAGTQVAVEERGLVPVPDVAPQVGRGASLIPALLAQKSLPFQGKDN